MAKIAEGTAPKKFTLAHLKSLGFTSSNDRGVLALLKDLGFPVRRRYTHSAISQLP